MSARKKVTIVGAGMTGGSIAQRLVELGYCDIVLKDEPRIVETLPPCKALAGALSGVWPGVRGEATPSGAQAGAELSPRSAARRNWVFVRRLGT